MGAEAGLTHYVHVLRRGWWIIVLTVVLATTAAVYASLRETSLYSSSADVFLSTQNVAASISNAQLPTTDPARAAATQAVLARKPRCSYPRPSPRRALGQNCSVAPINSSVTAASGADILTFSVTDHLSKVAQHLAEAYATAYTQYRRQVDTASIVRARQGIEGQLTQLKASGREGGAVYANLFEKDQELSTLQALQGSNALLIRTAGRAVQTQPKPVRNAALAAVLGLLLGVALAFLRDGLNTRVRTGGELQGRLDLPQLGRVPETPRRLRTGGRLVLLAEPLSSAAEPYRILATNLDFVNLERMRRRSCSPVPCAVKESRRPLRTSRSPLRAAAVG